MWVWGCIPASSCTLFIAPLWSTPLLPPSFSLLLFLLHPFPPPSLSFFTLPPPSIYFRRSPSSKSLCAFYSSFFLDFDSSLLSSSLLSSLFTCLSLPSSFLYSSLLPSLLLFDFPLPFHFYTFFPPLSSTPYFFFPFSLPSLSPFLFFYFSFPSSLTFSPFLLLYSSFPSSLTFTPFLLL